MKKLSVVTLVLILSLLVNIALVGVLVWLSHSETCDVEETYSNLAVSTDYVNVFEDLTREEINQVLEYLYSQKSLNLVTPNKANLTTNYILGMELHLPNKSSALSFLDHEGEKPVREARAFLFLPQNDPPVVEEYIVSPIPNPTRHYRNPRRNKSIPYRVRQFSNTEMMVGIALLQKEVATKVENMLKRSYQAAFTNCNDKCLTFTASVVSTAYSKERKLWISSLYQQELSTLHPVGFQILLNMEGINASNWKIEKIWYANKMFDSVDELVRKYENNEIPKLFLEFPEAQEGENSTPGSLHRRGHNLFPDFSKAGPNQYEPHGHRYTLHRQHVEYMNWKFNFRMSFSSGIQLYDIRFRNERIIYELSMQEIAVIYAGASPGSLYAQLADSAFGFGNRAHGLMPGVDCPEYATFADSTMYNEDFMEPRTFPSAICIFEHNPAIPLRRHKSDSVRSGYFYAGLVDYVLIVRTIFVMFNYDYIVDFVFHQDGALDLKIHSTGFIMSSLYSRDEAEYGMKMTDTTVGTIHQHLFNFKADMDILGTKNRYVTLDTETNNKTRKWLDKDQYFSQLTFKRRLKKTELQAALKYNFDTPKKHLIVNNAQINKFSEPRGYSILCKGFTKQILPQEQGFEKSMSWSRYQMAITKRKESELSSSSMHSMFDGGDPIVNFQEFLDDDEDIVDEDLVAWITLGMHHLPRTEDVPNTATTGNEMSITFLPHNYFPEDPSMASRDAVRVDADVKATGNITIQTYGTPHAFRCGQEARDFEKLLKNGSALFLRLSHKDP